MAKDVYGNEYITSGGNAPTAGGTIYVPDGNGGFVQGTWMGHVTK